MLSKELPTLDARGCLAHHARAVLHHSRGKMCRNWKTSPWGVGVATNISRGGKGAADAIPCIPSAAVRALYARKRV